MSFASRFERLFKQLLPSPFSIAILLTLLTFLLALVFTKPQETGVGAYAFDLLGFWKTGLWDGPLMIFAMQMMLMLVLGHVLAISPPANKLINRLTGVIGNTAQAAALVAFFTMLVAFFNWGLGLIFGAIFARKVAESAVKNGWKLNYPLVGAAGYVGLMVWHGGLSGSAPVKANEPGHIKALMAGMQGDLLVPDLVPIEQTIFSGMNGVATLLVLTIIPLVLYSLGKRLKPSAIHLPSHFQPARLRENAVGAEKIDVSVWFGKAIGIIILAYAIAEATVLNTSGSLGFLTPNYINAALLGLGLLLHTNIRVFLAGVDEAIADAAGILIQFPLYFGIMGLMRSSGLVQLIAESFTSFSTAETFPLFTFISSGIINVFVPSGGGQWSIQAPILIEASQQLEVPLSKSIMALAYGDQLTNMLQPFWALPLLGITGLKAKEILPYTLLLMLIGFVIYFGILVLF
jgi:short-chain fatty acids transporter